ncbi:MAG: alpha/beta hydrolase [Croceibacterium sp.]
MPPILLIPGNMCDERLWQPVAERLAAEGHIVRFAPPLADKSISVMAAALALAIEGPVVAVGFSMGAIVATELATRTPERVAALGLIAFNASADLPERAAVRPRQQHDVLEGKLQAVVADELKPNYLADENRGDTGLLTTVMAMARALGPETFVAQSEALRLRRDLRPALADLGMPVLLACGSEDRLCPPEWHRNWGALIGPNARFFEVPGAGHLLPLEKPHALADALIGWLAEEVQCQTVL